MSFDEEQDGISLGELDSVREESDTGLEAAEDAAVEAAATEDVDDSQLSEEDGMRRRSAARRAERDRKKARRRELRSKNPETGKGRRIATIVIAIALCVCLVAGGVYYFYFRGHNAANNIAGNGPDQGMDFGSISVITASGTTSIGMSMETFELNLSDVDLEIEEVYVSNRDEVEEGQAILKISEESIESARTTLRQAAKSAEYAYQLNEVDAQEDVIEAKDTYEQALLAYQYAEQDYADTISEAQAEIDDLEDQIEDQQELVDEYQAAVDDDDYYNKEYKVAELKAQLEKDQTLLQEIYDDTSNGVQDHLDYVKGGSYEAWKSGTQTTTANTNQQQQQSGQQGGQQGGMPEGGGQGGPQGTPPTQPGNTDNTNGNAGSADGAGTGTTGGTGTSSTGGGATGDTGTGNTGSGTTESSGTSGTDGSTGSTESAGTSSSDSTGTDSSAGQTDSSTTQSETTETVTNNIYNDEAPAMTSGMISAPSGSTSGVASTTGTTSSASTSGSSSSSGSATISDEYEGSSDTTKSLSTSDLTTSDITTWPWYAAYVALDEEVTEEHEEYEAAVTKAERAQSRASSLLPQAKNKLESLQLQLRTAQNELITTKEEAQETLDTAKAEAEAAEETYNTSIRSIENTADTLQDAMDEADENLASFEEQIGDGYLYTSNAGTIMMVNAEEGTTLSYNQVIVAYTDPGTISVTAAVDQSNIASITVGDTTAVVFEDAGIYQGFVSAINPVTQSSSRTSVTYSVTITLKGDVSAVSENISATVYFGDAVPLVFEQAGDQYHDPDAADTTDYTEYAGEE